MARHRYFVIAFILGFAVAEVLGAARKTPPIERPLPGALTGTFIPDVQLVDMDGNTTRLLDRIQGSPSLLVVLDEEACLGCGDYGTEIRILNRELPHLKTVLIGTGPDTTVFLEYFRRNRIEGLLDPGMNLGNQVGLGHTPLVAVVDPTGRVLFVDPRGGPQSQTFPMSHVLPELTHVLASPSGDSRSRAP